MGGLTDRHCHCLRFKLSLERELIADGQRTADRKYRMVWYHIVPSM
jgi:hypothetical protein